MRTFLGRLFMAFILLLVVLYARQILKDGKDERLRSDVRAEQSINPGPVPGFALSCEEYATSRVQSQKLSG